MPLPISLMPPPQLELLSPCSMNHTLQHPAVCPQCEPTSYRRPLGITSRVHSSSYQASSRQTDTCQLQLSSLSREGSPASDHPQTLTQALSKLFRCQNPKASGPALQWGCWLRRPQHRDSVTIWSCKGFSTLPLSTIRSCHQVSH